MNKELDLTTDVDRDIIITRNRTLNEPLRADIYQDGVFQYPFEFSGWTGATMEIRIKPNDNFKLLTFSINDGSIILDNDGVFWLVKSADELSLRAGDYWYDMYLSNPIYPKYAFMKGRFIVQESISK
ncbi:hypothetical protein WSM22_03320 [Cytophagales bacterium WSM2-2]|nr:hypothetical protein WSM22_03320 [Cytophagales bacterium WSM2-2]